MARKLEYQVPGNRKAPFPTERSHARMTMVSAAVSSASGLVGGAIAIALESERISFSEWGAVAAGIVLLTAIIGGGILVIFGTVEGIFALRRERPSWSLIVSFAWCAAAASSMAGALLWLMFRVIAR